MADYNLTDVLDLLKAWGVDYPNKQRNRVKYDAFKKDLRKKLTETFELEADALAAVTPELLAPVQPNAVTGQTMTYSARQLVWAFSQPRFFVWVVKHAARQDDLIKMMKQLQATPLTASSEEAAQTILTHWSV